MIKTNEDIEKQLEYLRDKRLLMPKMYSFDEVRMIIDYLDSQAKETKPFRVGLEDEKQGSLDTTRGLTPTKMPKDKTLSSGSILSEEEILSLEGEFIHEDTSIVNIIKETEKIVLDKVYKIIEKMKLNYSLTYGTPTLNDLQKKIRGGE